MKTTPLILPFFTALILLTALACSSSTEEGFSEDKLRKELLGNWEMTDIPAAEETWQFRADGTYRMQMGSYEDYGTWELKKRVLVLDRKQNEAEEIFITDGRLEWGTYSFKRAGGTGSSTKAVTVNATEGNILGTWKLRKEGEATFYAFNKDNTYSVTLGEGSDANTFNGTWEMKDGKMVLDGHDESASGMQLRNGMLVWRDESYDRVGSDNISSNGNLMQELTGTWATKVHGPEVSFTFKSDGTFTSYDGRYETKGRWALNGTELVLDGYQGSASNISISGNQLKWDGVNYQRK